MNTKISRNDETELKVALDNRAFEIQLFWQRSNYFLVLMTALGVGVFTIKNDVFALFIALFAAVTSWYWYQTNLGSKFWQESWEVEVVALAKRMGIASFERPTSEIIDQVRNSLTEARQSTSNLNYRKRLSIIIRRAIDKQIVKKPSVSHYMILLSLTSIILWTLVSLGIIASILGFSISPNISSFENQRIVVVSNVDQRSAPVSNDKTTATQLPAATRSGSPTPLPSRTPSTKSLSH